MWFLIAGGRRWRKEKIHIYWPVTVVDICLIDHFQGQSLDPSLLEFVAARSVL